MKKAQILVLLCVLPALLCDQTDQNPNPRPIVFTHVTVIDVTGAPPKRDMMVVITGDRIIAMGEKRKVKMPKGAQVVDAAGKYLIPGLWDMHVHLSYAKESSLPLLVANGVTSVRDMGSDFAEIQAWREKITAGKLLGPRIKTAGPALESARFLEIIKRVDQVIGKPLSQAILPTRIGVANAEDAERAVRSLAKMGVDFVKIRTSPSREAYLAVAVEAKRLGLPFVGHNPMVVSLIEASDAGQRSIEHIPFFSLLNSSEAERRGVFARFVKNGTWIVPTIGAVKAYRMMPDNVIEAAIEGTDGSDMRRRYVSAALLDFWRMQILIKKLEPPRDWAQMIQQAIQDLRAMHRAGIQIMAGTDLSAPLIFPGFSLHDELELLIKEVGMTPIQALQSATRNPAEFFGVLDSLGTIERGKIADLVLLEANPLEDIHNTQKINAVVVNGKLVPKSELGAMLAKVEAAANKK